MWNLVVISHKNRLMFDWYMDNIRRMESQSVDRNENNSNSRWIKMNFDIYLWNWMVDAEQWEEHPILHHRPQWAQKYPEIIFRDFFSTLSIFLFFSCELLPLYICSVVGETFLYFCCSMCDDLKWIKNEMKLHECINDE